MFKERSRYTATTKSTTTGICLHRSDIVRVLGEITEVLDRNKMKKALQNITLLQNLSPSELDILTENFHVKTYKNKAYIIKQGELGDSFYILHKGKVRITKTLENGSEDIIRTLVPEDCKNI